MFRVSRNQPRERDTAITDKALAKASAHVQEIAPGNHRKGLAEEIREFGKNPLVQLLFGDGPRRPAYRELTFRRCGGID